MDNIRQNEHGQKYCKYAILNMLGCLWAAFLFRRGITHSIGFHTMRSKPGHISESVPDFVNNYFWTVYTSYIIYHYSIRMKGSGAVNRHLSLHRSPFSLSSFQNARKLHCRIAVEFSCIYPPEIRFIPPDYFDGMKKQGDFATVLSRQMGLLCR